MKTPILSVIVGFSIVLASEGHAIETLDTQVPKASTNRPLSLTIDYLVDHYLETDKDDPNLELWPSVSLSIEDRGQQIVADKIGFVSQLRLNLKRNELGYGYHAYYNDIGTDAVLDSIWDGTRDVFAERFTLGELEDSGKTFWGRHVVPFFRGSVGNTEQERLNIVSAEPQSRSLDRSWWKEIRETDTGPIAYGAKVFRPDPYLYLSYGFGHIKKRPVILDLRIHTILVDDRVGNPKVKLGLILPTGRDSHIILGSSIYPLDMGLDDDKSSGSLRYEKVIFKNHRRTTFWSTGVETSSNEALVSVMVTSTW